MVRRKNQDDEIPLTVSKSTILQETKARFDTLLKTALSQDEVEPKLGKKGKMTSMKSGMLRDTKSSKKRSRKKLSSSTQKLVLEDGQSTSSETDNEYSSEVLPALHLDDVKDFTPISSSDELMLSPVKSTFKVDETQAVIHFNDSVMDVELISTPPKRQVPLPLKRHSTRDESRETTSSRVSSPDSVMTAIEASSPNRSTKLSSPENQSVKENTKEEYELKPLKGFSPSYEEIDETGLNRIESQQHLAEQMSIGLENAASYEEILEDQSKLSVTKRHDSHNSGETPIESARHETRNKENKKHKTQVSSQKRRAKDEFENTDTSSSDKISVHKVHTKHKRHAGQLRKKNGLLTKNKIHEETDVHYTYDKIIGITLHRCDTLKIDSLIRHPMVRVHVLDTVTGEYLKKSQPSRNASYFQENPNINYIQPLTTQPCNFKDPRSLTPIWEETLLFNEDIKHILQPHSSVLILFEVLDCVSFDDAIAQYQRLGSESGWHRIAWAFLKPCGPNNILNIDKKLRLQLYKPRFDKTFKSSIACDKCDVYRWWIKGGWIHYPSTLHITVNSFPMPSDVAPALRSYFALQPEHCTVNSEIFDDVNSGLSDRINTRGTSPVSGVGDLTWSRLPSQSCKVPNEKALELPAGLKGSFSIKFNHRGNSVAVTATNQSLHNIFIYSIPEGTEVARFQGHPGLIYSLDWSFNDDLLLSASADCTACIWSVKSEKYTPSQMLPHPSFVYCAVFLPTNPLSLATGCCDHAIRIWRKSDQKHNFELQQELSGHEGYVSTLCVNSDATLFSGDSTGQIRMWQCRDNKLWAELRILNVRELVDVVLSHLILHPGGKRLLVLARDSLLRMIDISTGVAIQWFKGALNQRIQSKACISPCGGYVFSPSEDGTFYVWNADTGILVASYSDLFYTAQHTSSYRPSHKPQVSSPILSGAVDYHPHDHLTAFAIYGTHSPVIICKYNRNVSGKEIGLHIKHDRLSDLPENETSDEEPKINSFAQSAFLVSKVKAHAKPNQFKEGMEYGQGFQVSSTNYEPEVIERQKKGGDQHLSSIIQQLDYVLQLGRVSRQERGAVTPDQTTTDVPDSSQKLSISHANIHEVLKNNNSLQNSEISDHEVSYSVPHSNIAEQQQSEPFEGKSNKEELASEKSLATSPVQLHYVQEKLPRPLPRKRRSKTSQLDRRQSVAELSTTDTSLMSSENEDSVKSFIKPQPLQIFHENELSQSPAIKPKLPMHRRVQVQQTVQAFSSFDSDSDLGPKK